MLDRQPLDGVDRTEHLGEVGAGRREVEREVVAVAEQPVRAVRQAVSIELEPVSKTGLHDAVTGLDLVDQAVDVGHVVVGHTTEMLRDDRAEQQPSEPGCRIDREHHVPERDPSGRLNGTTVEDLQFGQQHVSNATDGGVRLRDRQT